MLEGTRVLILEDEAGGRALDDLLTAEGCAIESLRSGVPGATAAQTGFYDLILLNIMHPGDDGAGACRELRAASVATPIVLLSASGGDGDIIEALRSGADDCLQKPFDSGVLVARMEALLRRSKVAGKSRREEKCRFGEFCLDRRKGELAYRSQAIPLNAQEYRLLDYLVANPDRIIGREEMLDTVWGYDADTTTRTIDVHVAKLRQKLGESEKPRHILTIRGKGYKFVG